MTKDEEVLAEVSAHQLETVSEEKRNVIYHNAVCSCGEAFAWYSRRDDHLKHVILVAAEIGRQQEYDLR